MWEWPELNAYDRPTVLVGGPLANRIMMLPPEVKTFTWNQWGGDSVGMVSSTYERLDEEHMRYLEPLELESDDAEPAESH